jgi:Flp pilus assembly pilin Flp
MENAEAVSRIHNYDANFNLTTRHPPGMMDARHNAQTAEGRMGSLVKRLWSDDQGQDIAEYAVMLAVILVLVVGTIRLIGTSSNNVFSEVASSVGQ